MAYITWATYKEWAGFPDDDEQTFVEGLIGEAGKIIENYTQRVFEIDSATDQTFSRVASLPGPSRFSGSTLYFYEELATDSGVTITDSPTVIYLPEDGPPYYGCHLTDGAWAYPTVTVNGKWGYSETPPSDIKTACKILTKWLYDGRDKTDADRAVVTPQGEVLIPEGLPKDAVAIMNKYKKVALV